MNDIIFDMEDVIDTWNSKYEHEYDTNRLEYWEAEWLYKVTGGHYFLMDSENNVKLVTEAEAMSWIKINEEDETICP